MRIATEQGFVFWHASGTLYSARVCSCAGESEEGLRLFQKGLAAYRATGAGLGLPYYLSILGEALDARPVASTRLAVAFDEAFELVEKNDERFQEAELHRLRGELHLAETNDEAPRRYVAFNALWRSPKRQGSRAWELARYCESRPALAAAGPRA